MHPMCESRLIFALVAALVFLREPKPMTCHEEKRGTFFLDPTELALFGGLDFRRPFVEHPFIEVNLKLRIDSGAARGFEFRWHDLALVHELSP